MHLIILKVDHAMFQNHKLHSRLGEETSKSQAREQALDQDLDPALERILP